MSGAFRKNPSRRRARAADLEIKAGLGDAPQDWIERAPSSSRHAKLLAIWKEIVAQDVLRVLNLSHRSLVESTCYLTYKIREANAGYGKATSGDFAQLKASLAAMGMTPVDSSRVAEAVRVPDRGGPGRPGPSSSASWGEYVG